MRPHLLVRRFLHGILVLINTDRVMICQDFCRSLIAATITIIRRWLVSVVVGGGVEGRGEEGVRTGKRAL